MSEDALNFIHEINTQNDCLKIKVRIVRIWKQSFSLDMILMDEKGKKIQGTIKAKLIHNFKRFLAEDLTLSDDEVKNLTLYRIEQLLLRNGSSLKNFEGMPFPDAEYILSSSNRLIHDEVSYDKDALKVEHDKLFRSFNDEQRYVYETIISAVEKDEGGVFFVYGYGGTGKTFIWRTLSAALRSKGEILLNVASSGIASLLLPGGRTAHSRFVIPININEDSLCSINPNSDLAALLRKTKLIIWDEAPMIHKHCFEALDKTLRDILRSTTPCSEEKLFGGKVVVFGGDFRQILPVIPKGSRHDIVNSSLNSSYI
ncbi:hypothetical protein OSB04_000507 [Centaurea solstitialis]|uniref:ATP-dependent DNA helicase n=1 Tax=Centaurea solstitialis TaxID=347529 RepID=A0AA38U1V9_9ASTR|nr:hypothetical protein OSB04_000507 [Centaurea solstitialis]